MKKAVRITLLPALSLIFMLIFASNARAATNEVSLTYQVYFSESGWSSEVNNGDICYTTSETDKAEAIRIIVKDKNSSTIDGFLTSKGQMQTYGWLSKVSNGGICGIAGDGRRLEAINISLNDNYASKYDIYYRVNISSFGWTGWAIGGTDCGSMGLAEKISGIQIVLNNKSEQAPGEIVAGYRSYATYPLISYRRYSVEDGWSESIKDSKILSDDKMQEIKKLDFDLVVGTEHVENNLLVKTFESGIGWSEFYAASGEVGCEEKNIQTIALKLSDEYSAKYDIYYRVYVKDMGWLSWTKNGEYAGTSGMSKPILNLQVKIIEKGAETPETKGDAYVNEGCEPIISYSAHVAGCGWLHCVGDGDVAGTTGKSIRMEAFILNIQSDSGESLNEMVECKAHVASNGWLGNVKGGNVTGTTGQSKRLEGFQISLKGELAEEYSIYYRAYIGKMGWLSWTCDGKTAGTTGYATAIEAIQIKLIPKNENPPVSDSSLPACYEKSKDLSVKYQAHVGTYGWLGQVTEGKTAGTTGQSKRLEALKINLVNDNGEGGITYRSHLASYGWIGWSSNGNMTGTTGQARRMEAIEIKLTGELAKKYDIYYRIHSQTYGWLGWACNGEKAGTTGLSKRAEAIEIKILPKGFTPPEYTRTCYVSYQNIGIDVSSHNGKINWGKIKSGGVVDFAMIRCGYRGYTKGTIVTDSTCEYNIKNALANGLKVGLYFYSTATSEAEAIEEALKTIEIAKKYRITYPIVYDYEYIDVQYDSQGTLYRTWGTTKTQRSNYAIAFLKTIKKAGYRSMMYGCSYDLKNKWETDRILKETGCELWEANYGSNVPTTKINTYTINKNMSGYEYDIYQFTSSGIILDAMDSAYVDVNVTFKNY
ncbi:MAG: hypothetical protein K6G26_13740 [Lachnospiraceae bacterium]|nr:hypothetical protein [Lachnospiraceae bacterium]